MISTQSIKGSDQWPMTKGPILPPSLKRRVKVFCPASIHLWPSAGRGSARSAIYMYQLLSLSGSISSEGQGEAILCRELKASGWNWDRCRHLAFIRHQSHCEGQQTNLMHRVGVKHSSDNWLIESSVVLDLLGIHLKLTHQGRIECIPRLSSRCKGQLRWKSPPSSISCLLVIHNSAFHSIVEFEPQMLTFRSSNEDPQAALWSAPHIPAGSLSEGPEKDLSRTSISSHSSHQCSTWSLA